MRHRTAELTDGEKGPGVDRPDWSALRSMMDDLQRARRNLGDTQRRMFKIKGEARSDDRMIKAVVGPRGHLVHLELDPRVFRNPDSKTLASAIVETVKAAVEDSLRQNRALREELLPKDMLDLAARGQSGPDLLSVQDADLEGDDDG